MTDAYIRAHNSYIQRCKEQIAINETKIKFLDQIWWMYNDGILTRDEFLELFEMV